MAAKKSKKATRVRLTPEAKAKLAARIVDEAKKLKKSGVAKSEAYEKLRAKFKVKVRPFFKAAGWEWGKAA